MIIERNTQRHNSRSPPPPDKWFSGAQSESCQESAKVSEQIAGQTEQGGQLGDERTRGILYEDYADILMWLMKERDSSQYHPPL